MQFWMSSHIICSITCSHWIPLFDLVSPDFFLFLVSIVLAQGVSISCALKQLLPWSRCNLWSCRGMCVWNSSVWEIGKAWLYHVLEALAIQLSSKKKKKYPLFHFQIKKRGVWNWNGDSYCDCTLKIFEAWIRFDVGISGWLEMRFVSEAETAWKKLLPYRLLFLLACMAPVDSTCVVNPSLAYSTRFCTPWCTLRDPT